MESEEQWKVRQVSFSYFDRHCYKNAVFFSVIVIVTVIRTPHGDPLIFGFVVLHRREAR